MSRVTVGKKWPRRLPRGDCQAMCQYCGVQWHRSELRKDGSGLLACPDEGMGLSVVELTQLVAGSAQEYANSRVNPQSTQVDNDDGSETPIQRTTLEDIEL